MEWRTKEGMKVKKRKGRKEKGKKGKAGYGNKVTPNFQHVVSSTSSRSGVCQHLTTEKTNNSIKLNLNTS